MPEPTPRPAEPRIVVHESDACQGNITGWYCADCDDDACECECHHTEPTPRPADEETPDECTGCGRDDGPMYLDTRPRHPSDPQAVYCRDCAADLFDLSDEEPTDA